MNVTLSLSLEIRREPLPLPRRARARESLLEEREVQKCSRECSRRAARVPRARRRRAGRECGARASARRRAPPRSTPPPPRRRSTSRRASTRRASCTRARIDARKKEHLPGRELFFGWRMSRARRRPRERDGEVGEEGHRDAWRVEPELAQERAAADDVRRPRARRQLPRVIGGLLLVRATQSGGGGGGARASRRRRRGGGWARSAARARPRARSRRAPGPRGRGAARRRRRVGPSRRRRPVATATPQPPERVIFTKRRNTHTLRRRRLLFASPRARSLPGTRPTRARAVRTICSSARRGAAQKAARVAASRASYRSNDAPTACSFQLSTHPPSARFIPTPMRLRPRQPARAAKAQTSSSGAAAAAAAAAGPPRAPIRPRVERTISRRGETAPPQLPLPRQPPPPRRIFAADTSSSRALACDRLMRVDRFLASV